MGQPYHMYKASERAFVKKRDKLENKVFELMHEIQKLEDTIENMELTSIDRGEEFAQLFDWKGRIKMNVNNLQAIKKMLEDVNAGRVKAPATKATMKKWKWQVEDMERRKAIAGDKPKALQDMLDAGEVVQWDKKPNIFFIKGLKKVAIELQNGELKVSSRYYPRDNDLKASDRIKNLKRIYCW